MASVVGDNGNNVLAGTVNNDTIIGNGGNDEIRPDGGSDVIDAGSGDDTIVNLGGRDTVNGGDGVDWVVTDLSQSVLDDLNIAPNSFTVGLDLETGFHGRVDSDLGTDQYSNIENYEMIGNFDTELFGDDGENYFIGDSGQDTMVGRGGHDTLEGNGGNDQIWGGLQDTVEFEGVDYTRTRFTDFDVAYLMEQVGIRGAMARFEFFEAPNGDLIAFDAEETQPSLFIKNEFDDWSESGFSTVLGYTIYDVYFDGNRDYLGWIYESDYHGRDGLFEGREFKHYAYQAFEFDIDIFDAEGVAFLELLGVGEPGAYTIDNVAGFSLLRRVLVSEDGSERHDLVRLEHIDSQNNILGAMEVDLETGALGRRDSEGSYYAVTDHPQHDTVLDGWMDLLDTFVGEIAPYNDSTGQDILRGGDGDDYIHGGIGQDVINGDAGNDTLNGGLDDDYVDGGAGDDLLEGYSGRDHLIGGDGNDTIYASGTVMVSPDDDIDQTQVFDGAGNDTVIGVSNGGVGIDVNVGSGNDFYKASGDEPGGERLIFDPTSEGERTEKVVVRYTSEVDGIIENDGYGGRDEFEGFQRVTASAGDDELYGAEGHQRLWGREGNDTIYGMGGDDELRGEGGNDLIFGGDGSDWIHGGGGDDTLTGGEGFDNFVLLDPQSRLTVEDYESYERIVLNSPFTFDSEDLYESISARYDETSNTTVLSIAVAGASARDMVFVKGEFDIFSLILEDDQDIEIKLVAPEEGQGGMGPNVLNGTEGDDTIHGQGGDDTVYGNGGNDRLHGDDGNDELYGGAGDDQLLGGTGDDIIDGGPGTDRVSFWDIDAADGVDVNLKTGVAVDLDTGDRDTLLNIENISGSANNDILVGNNQSNGLDGHEGNDTITGNGGGDNLWGREGDDVIYGNDGDDNLLGHDGNDALYGGSGRDFMGGDDGDDVLDASGGDAESQGWGDMVRPGLGNDTIIGHQEAWELRQDGVLRSNGENHSGLDLLYDDPYSGFTSGIKAVISGDIGDGYVTSIDGSDDFYDEFTYTDRIEGTQFADHIIGSNQRAESYSGEAGDDTIDGGSAHDDDTKRGFDTIDYRYELSADNDMGIIPQAVYVDLDQGYAIDTFGDRDTLINIEGAFGSHLDDTLRGSAAGNYLVGDDGNDAISGFAGDDWMYGGRGNDVLHGGAGDDHLDAGAGNDYLYGEDGDDTIYQTGSGTQLYDGGDGNDTFVTEADKFENYNYNGFIAQVNLTTGFSGVRDNPNHRLNDRVIDIENVRTTGEWLWELIGDQGSNRLETDAGNDTLWGLSGNDTLDAGAGDDVVIGGLGSDFVFANRGNDSYFGGEGEDILDFGYLGDVGVIVDTASGIASGGNVFEGFEGFIGTSGNDTMTGRDTSIGTSSHVERNAVYGSADNYELFRAGTGDDTIDGAGGYDEVSYGGVADALTINLSVTTAQDVRGDGSELDTILNVEGVEGGNGDDTIIGNSADNSLDGRFGNNDIDGGAGFDFVEYNGAGRSSLVVDLSLGKSDFVRSSSGDEFTDTLRNIEGVIGSVNGDHITGDDARNVLYGVDGNDTLIGGAGDDVLSGGKGADHMYGGTGKDIFLYDEGDGRDTIFGFNADDDVIKSDLEYSIYKEANSNNAIALFENGSLIYLADMEVTSSNTNLQVAAKEGNTLAVSDVDIEIAGAAREDIANNTNFEGDAKTAEAITNAASVQRATVDLSQTADSNGKAAVSLNSVADETAQEAIILDLGNSNTGENLARTIEVNNFAAVAVEGEARLRGGQGDNTFLGDGARQDVNLGAGDDYLSGGGGNDTIGSSGGDDTILGGAHDDVVYGGIGNDYVDGGLDDDYVSDALGNDTLLGGAGDDTIRSFDGGDMIDAGSGNDTVYGGYGADNIAGGAGADVLYGDTVLFASRGNDTLDGGSGNDLLQGGFGADTFVFHADQDGRNTITRIDGGGRDFEAGVDLVELHGFNVTEATVMSHVSNNTSGDAVFLLEGVEIIFDGVSRDDLTATDFDIIA